MPGANAEKAKDAPVLRGWAEINWVSLDCLVPNCQKRYWNS